MILAWCETRQGKRRRFGLTMWRVQFAFPLTRLNERSTYIPLYIWVHFGNVVDFVPRIEFCHLADF